MTSAGDYRITPAGADAARGEAQRMAELVRWAQAPGLAPEVAHNVAVPAVALPLPSFTRAECGPEMTAMRISIMLDKIWNAAAPNLNILRQDIRWTLRSLGIGATVAVFTQSCNRSQHFPTFGMPRMQASCP